MDEAERRNEQRVLKAGRVYLLMSQEYRISRNRRAEWFFSHLNTTLSIKQKYKLEEYSEELEIVSVIPKDSPPDWSIEASHLFRYLVCSDTIVEILSRKYRIVYCLDISPSVASVDVQTGMVILDGMFGILQNTMEGLVKPFYVPGSYFIFQPKIYVTVIAHAPFLSSYLDEVIIQGVLLDDSTYKHVLQIVFRKLGQMENKVAELTASCVGVAENAQNSSETITPKPSTKAGDPIGTSSLVMSPDFGLVDLLRHALIALYLLPENSASGLIVITDGVISVPDGGYLDLVLSQLRYNTVSCSFVQLSSPFHPHACYGILPYSDLMRFISTATFGAFLSTVPKIEADSQAMNIYHKSFLTWSFQESVESFKNNLFTPSSNKPGEWSVQNSCFSSYRDMPIVKKQQYETTMNIDYMKILSCRLREGFTIKEVHMGKDNMLQIKMVLPWKFLILIEYVLITPWPAQPKVTCIVSLEAPYDFLHDVTCLAKKPFQSYYRQLLVNTFWASQKNLSESDKLLVHFNSFCSNPAFYNIPESLKNGLPLFYISSNSSSPSFQSSEFAFPQFSQFWKPVCLLDTDIWQKWMHTHRIGVILEHDHPIPKHIHLPNSSGRFHVIQCRQTMMALNTLLKDWSSFVLVENNSYIKLMYKEKDKPPYSFCIIRVTTKPPCVMLRLAFLVGTPGKLRHKDICELQERIAGLTFPQRLNEPPKWRVPSGNSYLANPSRAYKRTWSDMPCCVLLYKPIEKILIRYEQIPRTVSKTLLPQHSYNNWTNVRKTTSNQSTFGFRPTYSAPWAGNLGPEMQSFKQFKQVEYLEEFELQKNWKYCTNYNTIARYLHHRRWVWCVQNNSSYLLSMDCVARILSTITKMRLQEGLRFAYSSSGIVNMIMELELKNEKLGDVNPGLESIENLEDYERATSVLQYVMFPPVTTLISNVDEDDEDSEDDFELSEENSDLFLITECWIEPQSGTILSSNENTSFNSLDYEGVPNKIFRMDQECISSLVTFEHLSMMCHSTQILSPSEISVPESVKPLDFTEGDIKYIPFTCELKRILPKCQQAELLFSMFNQDLSMSYPVELESEISMFCDRANSILFDSWMANVYKMHDREIFLHDHEHITLYDLITQRQRALTHGDAPISRPTREGLRVYPKWRCFIKSLSSAHFLLSVLPASYHDLKLLMLLPHNLNNDFDNKAVFMLSNDDLNDSYLTKERSFISSPHPPQPGPHDDVGFGKYDGSANPDYKPTEPFKSCDSPVGSRKRCRIKSGSESGPASKKSLNRKSSLDNLFRCRTNSVEAAWKKRLGKGNVSKDLDDSSCVISPKTESEQNDSQFSFENQSRSHKLFPPNHQAKYGSITLPVYVYDCSLPTLTEHIIFRTCSGQNDIYTDCRICNTEESYPTAPTNMPRSPVKHVSPEPKSEEQELPPTNEETLQNHCHTLEVAFAKSYVHGLFESLQAGYYIHKKDIQEAIRLCRETRIEIKLSEYIQTVCRHFKEMKSRKAEVAEGKEDSTSLKYSSSTCEELKSIHEFIKRRFNQSILSTFNWVMDCAGIFYFKSSEQSKLCNAMNSNNSSKNVSDMEEAESMTVKAESLCSELTPTNATVEAESGKVSEQVPGDEILGSDFFTHDEGFDGCAEELGSVPLFFYLACTYLRGNSSGSFLIHDIPTCFDEISEALGDEFQDGDPDEKVELVMDFVFLTVPPEVEEVDYRVASTIRTSSMCSISPVPLSKKGEISVFPQLRERDISFSGTIDYAGKVYPSLPYPQYQAVKCVVEDVKWLLKDEITSFRWESNPLTELALTLVANHVEKSLGKPGCQVTIVPLNFVNSPSQIGYEKFKERFRKSTIEEYELKEEGSIFYLVSTARSKNVSFRCEAYPSSILKSDISLVTEENRLNDEMLKLSLENQINRVEFEAEDPEIIEIAERVKERRARKCSGQEVGRNRQVNIENLDGDMGVVKQENSLLTTPSQMSEISSIVESLNTNEDGYEGDGSDSAEDCVKREISVQCRNLPPFWILFKLSPQQVVIYFHCRYDEDNTVLYECLITLRNQVLRQIRQLKRIVNQDILLQQLHDTRHCSVLIEPKSQTPDYTDHELHYPPPITNNKIEDSDYENVVEPKQFPAGFFSCDVVWETKFILHSRLRVGPGKSLVHRGIQTLKATLIAFEVVNRHNMFVYRDSAGNVFYLRLYRMEEKSVDFSTKEIDDVEGLSRSQKISGNDKDVGSVEFRKVNMVEKNNEDVILLRVHGITEAGHEIKDNLVQSLRNKLDDAVLDILSVTLDRNPHCKLTQEDVAFIQRSNSPPDTVLKYRINSYASQHLPAFAFYLNQNLLQFFCIPKYTEFKSEFRFRDYSELDNENEQSGRTTIYLYNQRPGGTGSRGIACVVVSIVDSSGKLTSRTDWSRPSADAYTVDFNESEFEERVSTDEVVKNDPYVPPLMVELRMWKQGRINLDLLKGFLSSAIRHSIWDLTMEFYFLTAPLSTGTSDNLQSIFSFSAPSTPKVSVVAGEVKSSETVEYLSLAGRRNSIVLQPRQEKNGEDSETRIRSMSVNARKVSGTQDGKLNQGRSSSPMAMTFAFPGQTLGKTKMQFDPFVVGLNRLETGEIGRLHCRYKKLFTDWCEFGSKLNVSSLRMVPIDLAFHHPVETIVAETEKLVQQVGPDYDIKQFWKIETEPKDYVAGGLRIISEARLQSRRKTETELKTLTNNLGKLGSLFSTELMNYPSHLVSLFKEAEDFHPLHQGDECILISRNLVYWKFCVGTPDPQFFTPDAYKNHYKFPPLMSAGWDQPNLGASYMSLEKLPRVASASGLSCLMNEPEANQHPILIPRQKFLVAKVTNGRIFYIFYNWSKETMDRLIDSTKLLTLWINARSSLLCSVYAQKSGLFYNQDITRVLPPKGTSTEANPFTCGGTDVESLLRYQNPPKEFSPTRPTAYKKPKSVKNLVAFLESFRNIKHPTTAVKAASPLISDPFKAVDDQMNQIKSSEKAEGKSSIFQLWLSRGPSASNVIRSEDIQAFKQAARTLHYCLTPIIFLPRWRSEIALTRDNSIGVVKKPRAIAETKQTGLQMKYDIGTDRSRHDSGTSQKSLESTKVRSKSIWGLWHNSSSQLSQESQASSVNQSLTNLSVKKVDEKWHITLCESFIQEYMQYLQTLGFIPIHGKSATKKMAHGNPEIIEPERLRHVSGTSLLSTSSSQSGSSLGVTFNNFSRRVGEESGGEKVFYLQKSLPGGIILFEVGLCEPFFYAKIHTLEVTRIQSRKSWKGLTYQNILEFVSQCERMKTLMHLHSFTYDFHLRSIHSYICGRQLLFKQGYHITNFLDDFIKYYPKGPNFARNTVHIGLLTIQNVTTPATILFNYMLDKLYNMKVIRMSVERGYENTWEYILVDITSKKIAYRDKEDERQYDEFDLTLLITHDSPPLLHQYPVDPSVLRLKYYIILTSRRELYPKVNEESGDGKLCVVNTPEPLSLQRELRMYSVAADTRTIRSRKASIEENARAVHASDSTGNQSDSKENVASGGPGTLKQSFVGIREESVHYTGYFSSHEQMMQEIVNEQVVWVEDRIRDLVSTASVDCRRDLLWQRLLIGNERQKNKKEDLISRETVGPLSYWEFGELLELVHVKSLSEMDNRLACLLRQPVSFYQCLLKLITQGSSHNFRYFASHDKSTHHMAIFGPSVDNTSPKFTKHIVMLDINLDKRTSDLSVLFKDIQEIQDPSKPPELEVEILNLIESVVNICCYCWWWWSTSSP